jgi:hypothetical protein
MVLYFFSSIKRKRKAAAAKRKEEEREQDRISEWMDFFLLKNIAKKLVITENRSEQGPLTLLWTRYIWDKKEQQCQPKKRDGLKAAQVEESQPVQVKERREEHQ